MTCDLTNPIFTNEAAALDHMEADRWPNGATCPLCGSDNVLKMGGKTQAGMWMCNGCRGKFTVRTGTVFERSHIPLHKWLLATHLLASSKKGISAHQLHRMLGITYKSAWFMAHRIREAMAPTADAGPMGGEGKIVETDETEISPSRKSRPRKRSLNMKIVSLVERGGRVRSRNISKLDRSMTRTVRNVVKQELDPASTLHTDGAVWYAMHPPLAAKHESVDHSKGEYVRYENVFSFPEGEQHVVHTNSAEGYFSIFKCGLVGTYQIMSEQHLHRYLAEFDFRMSNRARLGVTDDMRAARILKGAEGKRLTYRQPHQA
jgi:transposase-like protein